MSILATPMLVDGRSAAAAAIAKPNRTQHAVFMDRCAIGRSKAHEEKREVANPLSVRGGSLSFIFPGFFPSFPFHEHRCAHSPLANQSTRPHRLVRCDLFCSRD